jgi:hypothetical protein
MTTTAMEFVARCSKGWGARCAASKGSRCRCACAGHNHGGRKTDAHDETLKCTPREILEYEWDEARPPRPVFPVSDDRVIDLVRITRPGPFGDVEEARVYLDGAPMPRRLVYHSPTGFEWGYGGSGPSDLALNILALVVSPKEAMRFHHDFKFWKIARIPRDGSRISLLEVRVWIDQQYDREEREGAGAA